MTDQPRVLGGRYQMCRVIGRGGMALVSQARDLRLGRDVAVKELRIDLAGDPTFQERFRREAQAAAGLNHLNIVSVYDTGEESDPQSQTRVPFIVMELVEGRTLRDILREGRPILPQRALEFTVGVLEALAYSHRAGIIHRDIKPANVMLTTTGIVKVMDFGIARAVSDTSSTMTQTAAVIGTAQYLSPEQARGESVDARSDIYSAGCLLYELLVGRPPFQGDSPVSVAYQHVREQPVRPSQLDPEVTPAMDAVVLKALTKNPDDRYATADQMREDVTRILEGRPVTATVPLGRAAVAGGEQTELMPAASLPAPPTAVSAAVSPAEASKADDSKPKSRTKLWWTVAIVALVLVGAVAGFFLLQQQAKPKQVLVPSVVNQPRAAAEASITAVGLKPVIEEVNGPRDATEGRVTDTDPKGGAEVLEGTPVKLKVNVGPQILKVPTGLKGKTFDEAKRLLVEAGFKEASIRQAEAETELANSKPDTVIDVTPSEGSAVPSTEQIKLGVATGRANVPYVRGKTYEQASRTLHDAGFTNVSREDQYDATNPAGTVLSTKPDADTRAQKTDKITLIVSKGPQPSPTPTPKSPSPSGSPSPSPTPSFHD